MDVVFEVEIEVEVSLVFEKEHASDDEVGSVVRGEHVLDGDCPL